MTTEFYSGTSGNLQRPELPEWVDPGTLKPSFKTLNEETIPALLRLIYKDLNEQADRVVYCVDSPITLPNTSGVWTDYNLATTGGLTVPTTAFGLGFDLETGGLVDVRAKLRKNFDGTTETVQSGQNVRLDGGERYGELPLTDASDPIIQYKSDASVTFKIRLWRVKPVKGVE